MNKLVILGAIVAGLVVINRKAQSSAPAPLATAKRSSCGCRTS